MSKFFCHPVDCQLWFDPVGTGMDWFWLMTVLRTVHALGCVSIQWLFLTSFLVYRVSVQVYFMLSMFQDAA